MSTTDRARILLQFDLKTHHARLEDLASRIGGELDALLGEGFGLRDPESGRPLSVEVVGEGEARVARAHQLTLIKEDQGGVYPIRTVDVRELAAQSGVGVDEALARAQLISEAIAGDAAHQRERAEDLGHHLEYFAAPGASASKGVVSLRVLADVTASQPLEDERLANALWSALAEGVEPLRDELRPWIAGDWLATGSRSDLALLEEAKHPAVVPWGVTLAEMRDHLGEVSHELAVSLGEQLEAVAALSPVLGRHVDAIDERFERLHHEPDLPAAALG